MRLKEESEDYRYFPEPDLPPLRTDPAWLASIRARLPELPAARRARYRDRLRALRLRRRRDRRLRGRLLRRGGGRAAQARPEAGRQPALQDRAARAEGAAGPARAALRARAGRRRRAARGRRDLEPERRRGLCRAPAQRPRRSPTSSASSACARSTTSALGAAIDKVVSANPAAVADYSAGKTAVVKFLVGQVMKETRGQANAVVVQQLLEERLAGAGS